MGGGEDVVDDVNERREREGSALLLSRSVPGTVSLEDEDEAEEVEEDEKLRE